MSRLDMDTLRSSGVLQEANRLFFHRLGLRLGYVNGQTVVVDTEDDGPPTLSAPEPEKAAQVAHRMRDEAQVRVTSLGFAVQPVEGVDDGVPAQFVTDSDEALEAFEAAIGDAARRYVEVVEDCGDSVEASEQAVCAALDTIWAAAVVEPDGVVRLSPARLNVSDGPTGEARTRWLVGAIAEMQEQHGELYPEDLRTLESVAARIEAEEPDDEDHEALERIYGFAQRSMRFFRGDEAARERWQQRKAVMADRIDAHRETLTGIQRLLGGERVEFDDPEAALAELDERAAPLREQVAALEAELATTRAALAPVEQAASRVRMQVEEAA